MSGRPSRAAALLALVLLSACRESAEPDGRSGPPRLVLADAMVFADPPPVPRVRAFDVLASDFDLDGDTDLLVNWHHQGPLELLENVGGRFRHPEGPPGAGLTLNLYASAEAMRERVREVGSVGLHLWHDEDRGGLWRLLWRDPEHRLGGLDVVIDTSLEILAVEGLEDGELARRDARRVRVRLGPELEERAFGLSTRGIAVRLGLHPPEGATGMPPLFVGPALAPAPPGPFDVWKSDPHGMAWLDLADSPHPELFVVRGGLGGALVPPLAPKHNSFFRHLGASAVPPYRLDPDATPADYGRDRRVEAVDVDNDGVLELWIGARDSANRLLARDPATGRFRDRAPALGLDQQDGTVGAWADHDGDGWQDLYLLEDGRLDLLRNVRGGRFERVSGASLGLLLPAVKPARGLFDAAQIRFADVDRDGDLDLWLLSHGAAGALHLFRRDGEGFVDATEALGLGNAAGRGAAVLVDLDQDALPDVVLLGGRSAVWHNRGAAGFERLPLPPEWAPRGTTSAAVLDADADGALDLMVVGRGRRLLWNRTQSANRSLVVHLPVAGGVPIGARVTARYSDGSRLVERFGSEHSTAYSQALQPLRFGIPAGLAIDRVSVRWPGAAAEEEIPVSGRQRLDLER